MRRHAARPVAGSRPGKSKGPPDHAFRSRVYLAMGAPTPSAVEANMSAYAVPSPWSLDAWLDECLDRFGLLRTLEWLDSGFDEDRLLNIILGQPA